MTGPEALVLHCELALLKLAERAHAAFLITLGEFEGGRVESMKASQCDELELVAQLANLLLEGLDGLLVEELPPVEGGRAVVGEQLVRVLLADRLRELAGLFDIRELHFLRFDHEVGTDHFRLSKELNMPRKLVPSGGRLNEHHCRRWLPITILKEIPESPGRDEPEYWIGLQRVRFLESGDEVLFISVARRLRIVSGFNRSVTLGLRIDETVRQRVRFLNDPAIPIVEVHTTCERCPLAEGKCEVRAAPPVVHEREQRNLGRNRALEELAALHKNR